MTTAQQVSETAEQPAAIDHHWVITIQFDNARRMATYDGSVSVVPGTDTRNGIYAALRQHMQQTVGDDRLVVLFFDLQPNQL